MVDHNPYLAIDLAWKGHFYWKWAYESREDDPSYRVRFVDAPRAAAVPRCPFCNATFPERVMEGLAVTACYGRQGHQLARI